jgi:hypothetical protein
MVKAKRTIQQYTENKRATGTHKHPGMIFGGRKNVCH